MHVLEMCGGWNDLITLDDDVRGEGSYRRVFAAAEDTKPAVNRVDSFFGFSDASSREATSGLQALGCDRVALPSTHWDEENTLIQELVSAIVRSDDNA